MITGLELFKTRTYQVLPIPYSNLLWKLSDGQSEHVVISPHVIQSSLSMINGSKSSQCICPTSGQNKFSKTYMNISAIVLNSKYQNISSNNELQSPSKPVIAVSSTVKLVVPAEIDKKKLVFTGDQVIRNRDYILVKVKIEDDENFELFFMQMNRPMSLSHNMLEASELQPNSKSSIAKIVVPNHEIKSYHDLASHFASDHPGHLYHKASLQFLPSKVSQKNGVSQTVPENVNRSEHEHVLTLDKNLVFILKYYKTVIQIGKLSAK